MTIKDPTYMEAPCICDYCKRWFDLDEGKPDLDDDVMGGNLICEDCHERQEQEETCMDKVHRQHRKEIWKIESVKDM